MVTVVYIWTFPFFSEDIVNQPVEMVIEFESLFLSIARFLESPARNEQLQKKIDAQHRLLRFESKISRSLLLRSTRYPPGRTARRRPARCRRCCAALFAVEKRFVGVVHVRRVGKIGISSSWSCENRVYPVFRLLVVIIVFDIITAVEHLRKIGI